MESLDPSIKDAIIGFGLLVMACSMLVFTLFLMQARARIEALEGKVSALAEAINIK